MSKCGIKPLFPQQSPHSFLLWLNQFKLTPAIIKCSSFSGLRNFKIQKRHIKPLPWVLYTGPQLQLLYQRPGPFVGNQIKHCPLLLIPLKAHPRNTHPSGSISWATTSGKDCCFTRGHTTLGIPETQWVSRTSEAKLSPKSPDIMSVTKTSVEIFYWTSLFTDYQHIKALRLEDQR